MLPYSPLHHLLLAGVGEPLVMTSGNVSDEPIAYRDDDARERLAGIADLVLGHDRPIETRTDDSVLRVARGRPLPLRRSRGAVPSALALPVPAEPPRARLRRRAQERVLRRPRPPRLGLPPHRRPQERRDAGLVRRGRGALRAAVRGRARGRGARPAPRLPLHDLRARPRGRRARRRAAPPRAPRRVPGRARRDRAGGGRRSSTARAWGRTAPCGAARSSSAACGGFERAGHLWPVPLPGGDAAVREPWRMACAWRAAAGGDARPLRGVDPERWRAVARMAETGTASPVTTSVGRLFDAVAALCGLRLEVSYEGQAAMELEAACDGAERGAYRLDVGGRRARRPRGDPRRRPRRRPRRAGRRDRDPLPPRARRRDRPRLRRPRRRPRPRRRGPLRRLVPEPPPARAHVRAPRRRRPARARPRAPAAQRRRHRVRAGGDRGCATPEVAFSFS